MSCLHYCKKTNINHHLIEKYGVEKGRYDV